MAATDSRAAPIRGLAGHYEITLYNSSGAPDNSGTLSAVVAKDGGTAVASTNTPVAIASTAGGVKIDLTSTEQTADVIYVEIDSNTAGVSAQGFTIYPRRANDGSLANFVLQGTAQAGAAATITLPSGGVATDDYYNGCYVQILSGLGVGQVRQILDYVGSTRVATVHIPAAGAAPAQGSPWVTNPDNTSVLFVTPEAITPAAITLDSNGNISMSSTQLSAIWDQIIEGAITARMSMRLQNSAAGGKTNGFVPGTSGTGNLRDLADTKNRVVAAYDANGNRTSSSFDLS